jgi:hypothetical protein
MLETPQKLINTRFVWFKNNISRKSFLLFFQKKQNSENLKDMGTISRKGS